MNKLVLGLAIVALVTAAGFAGTRAFFSDTETSQGNVFAAGSMDLLVGVESDSGSFAPQNLDDNRALFSFTGLVPGDSGTGSYLLNVDQEAYACVATDITSGANDLDDYLRIAFFNDADEDGVHDATEGLNLGPEQTGWSLAQLENYGYAGIAHDSPDGPSHTFLGTTTLTANTEYGLGFAYCFGEFEAGTLNCDGSGDHNDAQGDSVEGTLNFYAVQSANNDDFVCESLNEGFGELSGDITALRMNTHTGNYEGIVIDFLVSDDFVDAQSLVVDITRADNTHVVKTLSSDRIDELVNNDRSAGPTAITAPFPITEITYFESEDSYWVGTSADQIWTADTTPTKATVTITEPDGDVTETTVDLLQANGPYANLVD